MISSISLMSSESWGYLFSVDFTSKKERGQLNKKFISWLSTQNINCTNWYSEYDIKEIDGDSLVEITERHTKRYSINYEFASNENRREFANYVRSFR